MRPFLAPRFPALALAVLAACAPLRAADKSPGGPGLVWPPPPNEPRIVYVRALSKPADVGVKGSAFKRVANWFTGGDAGAQSLANPVGLAVDETGGLCLADTVTRKVSFYDAAANTWRQWDRAGAIAFNTPVSVAKRGDTIFVADSGLAQIIAFDTNGKLLFQINHDLKRPCGLALLGERLYAADVEGHCVVVFDPRGNRLASFGHRGAGPGEFNFPTHIAACQGHLLVTDSLNSRVQVFDTEGQFQSEIGGPGDTSGHFGRPKGVAVDSFGHVYVTDAVFDNIQIFDLAGRFLLNLGATGSGAGQFAMPNGVAISRDNHIYVADSCNHRVQVFQYVGKP
jgi:DNA-binding beta-propeller fold protein YncE